MSQFTPTGPHFSPIGQLPDGTPVQVDMGPFLRQEGRYPPRDASSRTMRPGRTEATQFRRVQPRPPVEMFTPALWVSWLMRRILQPG
jgi:hypothetical protein